MMKINRCTVMQRCGLAGALLLVGCDDTAAIDTMNDTSTDEPTTPSANDDDSASTTDDDTTRDDDDILCTPACSGKKCGDDGCGGSCGKCRDGRSCFTDYGVCVPDGMVYVPLGSFMRGCNLADDTACDSDELPHREITLSAFAIDKTEVTVAAYRECFDAGICTAPDPKEHDCTWNKGVPEDHPVVCVNWFEVELYCEWAGKRLPTEAEWEKAARGTDGRMYPWGNEALTCSHANTIPSDSRAPCVGSPSAVGSYPLGASPYGALDMVGNVWEWVADWYHPEYYVTAPPTDPQGPLIEHIQGVRVLRGGAYGNDDIPVWNRIKGWFSRSPGVGFRCAISMTNDDNTTGDDDDVSCTPSCTGRICGDDGCGGSCGTCVGGEFCNLSGYCQNMPSDMVVVPSGPFMRGCNSAVDAECDSDELPYKEITLSAFLIDKTEVTIAAYSECARQACTWPDTEDRSGCIWNSGGVLDDHPANCVNWFHAETYCTWAGKRLPTEAEWEKAARGTDGRLYPWGNEALTCERANVFAPGSNGLCVDSTVPVGSYPLGASPYGALDMVGNVWEWAADWYDPGYYATAPATDPQGPLRAYDETSRVLRGGSYGYDPRTPNLSYRAWVAGDIDSADFGFRCAISAQDAIPASAGAKNSETSQD